MMNHEPSPDTRPADFPFAQLIRQTGIMPMLGAGCAMVLVAFAGPVIAAWWFAGWSWWILAGVAAGVVCAAITGIVGARILVHRALTRLACPGNADESDVAGDQVRAAADPFELATELILTAYRQEQDAGSVFARLKAEDPACGAEVAAIVRERAIDDLVNGQQSDETRVQRFSAIADAVALGASRLGPTGAGEPWTRLAAEFGESRRELAAALDPAANQRERAQGQENRG